MTTSGPKAPAGEIWPTHTLKTPIATPAGERPPDPGRPAVAVARRPGDEDHSDQRERDPEHRGRRRQALGGETRRPPG